MARNQRRRAAARSALRAAALAAATACLPPSRSAAARAGRGAPPTAALVPPSVRPHGARAPLAAAAPVDGVPSDAAAVPAAESVLRARDSLVALASSLASESPAGQFLTRPSDKRELQRAIQTLEALSPAGGEEGRDLLLGDWTLVATASLPGSDLRRRLEGTGDGKNAPGWFAKGKKGEGGSLNPIQKAVRKSFRVTQRIRSDGVSSDESDGSGGINRVDNVIEITPLDTLEDVLPEDSPLSSLLGTVNINPLKVDKGKVVLVHKAEVESVSPVLRTKIAWVSSVANVAGTSRFLAPEGEDVFGVNNLLGEFVGVGAFDTPFVDEDVRVSRTSGPIAEQLRVFVRRGGAPPDDPADGTVAADVGSAGAGPRAKEVADAAADPAENARDVIEKDMEGVADALGDKLDDVAARVQDAVEGDLKQIGEAVVGVGEAMQGEGNVGEALADVAEAVAKVPGDVAGIVEDDRKELEGELREALEGMVADVTGSAEGDLKVIRDAATGGGEEKEEAKDESKKEEAEEESKKEDEEKKEE